MTEPEVQKTFDEFWAELVAPGGELDPEAVKRELHDYKVLLDAVPTVYCHVTGGVVSKPNTTASAVIDVADQVAADREAVAIADHMLNLRDEGYRIIEPEPESFVRKINGREAVLVRSEL